MEGEGRIPVTPGCGSERALVDEIVAELQDRKLKRGNVMQVGLVRRDDPVRLGGFPVEILRTIVFERTRWFPRTQSGRIGWWTRVRTVEAKLTMLERFGTAYPRVLCRDEADERMRLPCVFDNKPGDCSF